MTRLDGEKKSPLPWIIGLIVLALLAAAIYYFAFANRGPDQTVINDNGVELRNTAPAELDVDNSADVNAATANVPAANPLDTNSSAPDNSTDANAIDGNVVANSPESGSLPPEALSDVPVPEPATSTTPASADATSGAEGTVATRSKTIKTDDKTVTYKKSVKENGELVRDKKIVPKPVEEAKKSQ